MGGHMRSHFVFLPISPKPETSGDSKAQSKNNQPPTSGLADKRHMKRCTPIANPNNSSQLVIDQTCSLSRSDSDNLPDRNIAKNSLENPSLGKSKEIQQSEFPRVPMSSKQSTDMLSVTSSNEDVAHALVELSKGKFSDTKRKINEGKRKLDANRGGNADGEERKKYDGAKESRNEDNNSDQTHIQEQMSEQVRQYPAEPMECKKQLPDLNLPLPDEDDVID